MKKVTYNLGDNQIEELKQLSKKYNLSVGALIRIAINEYVKKENKNA